MERLYSAKVYANYRNQYPKMTFVQGDTEVNKVKLEFHDDINMPMANIATATASVKRPDGNTYTFGSESFEIVDNIVTFILPPAAVYTAGNCEASVSVYDLNGGRLTSDTFKYKVTDYLEATTPVDETNEYPVLTELIQRVQDVTDGFIATGASGVDVEVIDARKGEASLRAKIDKIDADISTANERIDNLQLVDTAISITDTAAQFTATTLDGVLSELFTNANNGQTAVANAIGSPSTATETLSQLAGDIETIKNTMAANLTSKGQTAAGTEALAALASKIASIYQGKKWASGTSMPSSGYVTVSGLDFTPKYIIASSGAMQFALYSVDISTTSYAKVMGINTANGENLDGTNTYVVNGGFRLLTGYGISHNWIAFE